MPRPRTELGHARTVLVNADTVVSAHMKPPYAFRLFTVSLPLTITR